MAFGELLGSEKELECRLEGGEGEFAAPESAGQRVFLDLPDPGRLADDDAALRTADELVAAETDDVGAGLDTRPDQRLGGEAVGREVDQGAAAEVVDDGDAAAPAEGGELLDPRFFGETDDAVVAVMDAEDGPGRLADGRLVVAEVGLVGRPDLAEDGAARGHDVGHAERTADLDELAARNDDLLAAGERVQDEDGRGGVVVGHGGRLGAGELPEQALDVAVAGDALAALEIEGQGRVTERNGGDGFSCGFGKDGPAEARVHDDARGVDGGGEGRGEFLFEAGAEAGDEGIRRDVGPGHAAGRGRGGAAGLGRGDHGPGFFESGPPFGHNDVTAELLDEPADGVLAEQGIKGGNFSERRVWRRVCHFGVGPEGALTSGWI